MPAASFLRRLYLTQFSKPASDRAIFQAICQIAPRAMMEIGIGSGERALRMIELAGRIAANEPITYVGIDLFESAPREKGAGLSLKQAHRLLKGSPARVQLIPGEPRVALVRSANGLKNIDLVVVSETHDGESLAGAWFFLPRMLHGNSLLLRQRSESGSVTTERMTFAQIKSLAARRPKAA